MKNKKELAIVFGITKNLDFALANVLIGMKKHCSLKKYDIIVYHNGLETKTQENINKISKCQFIYYKNKFNDNNLDEEYLKIYSNMCLSRFECFDLLKQYKKIIWHDVDILIQKDFKDLINYGNKTGMAMTYTDINFLVEANFNTLIEGYNMYLPLLNSGIIVFSDKLENYDKMSNWCYSAIEKYNTKLRYLDQGILNLLVQEFNISVEAIDINKYCCHPERKNVEKAVIVHSYGYDKFWTSSDLKRKFPEWVDNEKEWSNILKEDYKNMTCNNPKISVVMSIYERITHMKEAIESILNQTYGNFELLIVLEYTPKQEEIEKEIKKFNDPRIKIIKNVKKLGFAESLNVGIREAKGEYIARMDDDDISYPLRFQKQVEYLDNHKEISILGTAVETGMVIKQVIYPQTDPEKIKTCTLFNNQMFHPTVMMRKSEIIKYSLFYDGNYKTEDAELWSRAIKKVKITNIKDVLLYYRINSENETQQFKIDVIISDSKVIKKQLKENLNLDVTIEEAMLLSNRINRSTPLNNKKEIIKSKQKLLKKILKQNKKIKFYDQKEIKNLLEYRKHEFIKKILKPIISPIYLKLIYRIEKIIDFKINNIR